MKKPEWKINQEVYHLLTSKHNDDLNSVDIREVPDSQVLDYAIEYFTNDKLGWVYPSKSYVVAICYAKWLSKEFAEQFYKVLDDPNLLYNNDPYFVPYSQDKDTYDNIISSIGLGFDETKGVIPDIRKYFDDEILLKNIKN